MNNLHEFMIFYSVYSSVYKMRSVETSWKHSTTFTSSSLALTLCVWCSGRLNTLKTVAGNDQDESVEEVKTVNLRARKPKQRPRQKSLKAPRETAKSGLSLFISDVVIWSGRISLKVQHVTFGHMTFIPPTNRGQHITRVTVNWHRSPEKEGFGHS